MFQPAEEAPEFPGPPPYFAMFTPASTTSTDATAPRPFPIEPPAPPDMGEPISIFGFPLEMEVKITRVMVCGAFQSPNVVHLWAWCIRRGIRGLFLWRHRRTMAWRRRTVQLRCKWSTTSRSLPGKPKSCLTLLDRPRLEYNIRVCVLRCVRRVRVNPG